MNEEDIKDNLRKMLFNTTQANSCGLSNNDFIEEIRTLSSTLDLLDNKDKRIKQLEIDNKVLEQSLWEEGKGKYKD